MTPWLSAVTASVQPLSLATGRTDGLKIGTDPGQLACFRIARVRQSGPALPLVVA